MEHRILWKLLDYDTNVEFMSLVYKVHIDSQSGKKISQMFQKQKEIHEKTKQFLSEFNVTEWRKDSFSFFGGVGCVFFPKGTYIDDKIWKRSIDGYIPRANRKNRELRKRFDDLPKVSREEWNNLANFKSIFGTIGIFKDKAKTYYWVSLPDESMDFKVTDYVPPKDFIEVLQSDYLNELDKIRNNGRKK